MAPAGQTRRVKPAGSSPAPPFKSGKPPSYPSSIAEPAVRWVSKEPNLKRPPSWGFEKGDEQGVAWDWQSREWVAGNTSNNQLAKEDPLADVDPNQSAVDNANSATVITKPMQDMGREGRWVSEVEGNCERQEFEDIEIVRARRNPPAVRGGRRKGFYVTDVQVRRKPLQREPLFLRKEKNSRRHFSDKSANPRSPSMIDEMPYASYIQSPKTRFSNHKLGFVSDGPLNNFANASAKKQAEMLYKSYGSAFEAEHDDDSDDTESFHSERSACGMSWHWPGNQRLRQDIQTDSERGCFRVSKRIGQRKMLGHKLSSERSVSSFDSDSESAPLMTDTEQFNECSEDFAASSVELSSETPHLRNMNEFQFKRYGALDSFNMPGDQPDVKSRNQNVSSARKHRSLSQKYRPKLIKDLIGQPMVMESLSNAILRDKIAPVYLLHGPRGTGKTTAAKIFTAAMNCLSIEELRPCGLCMECTLFNGGKSYDIKEVDAAGNHDVESMRLLLSNISQPPTRSRYKVFIVDDCHTLSREAWNALLKSLEEPPSFVVFILITTELELLPRTAISRCQKFMFTRIKEVDIVHRLRKLALHEKIEIDFEALHFIAGRSDGSFRDAENLLDQLSLLGDRITLAMVQEMVGLISDEKLAKLLESALSADTVTTVNTIRELMETGVEPLALTSQLAALITDILAGKKRAIGSTTLRVREEDQLRLKQALKILSESEKQLRSCNDRTTWLTAAFLQLAPSEPCLLPSSSRGTSVVPSPMTMFDTSEKETFDPRSWAGDERWEPSMPLQQDVALSSPQGPCRTESAMQRQLDSNTYYDSGPFFDGHSGAGLQDSKASVPPSSRSREKFYSESNAASPCTMTSIWKKVVQGSRSGMVKQLLQEEGRLVSLAVTEAYSIARLEFQHPEHKAMAERARTSISNSFRTALGCPVEVEISLCTMPGEDNLVSRKNASFAQRKLEVQNWKTSAPSPINQEIEFLQRRGKTGSFRESFSSSRNTTPAIRSPLRQNGELRRPRHGFEADRTAGNKGAFDVFSKDLEFQERRSTEGAAWGKTVEAVGSEKNDQDCIDRDQRLAPSNMPETESSDSENFPDRDDPGALCWKGARITENKGKHQVRRRRRRRGRLLLRLVPCAKGSETKQDRWHEGRHQ